MNSLLFKESRDKINLIRTQGSKLIGDMQNELISVNTRFSPEFYNDRKSVHLNIEQDRPFDIRHFSAVFSQIIGEFPKSLDYIAQRIARERPRPGFKVPKNIYFPCFAKESDWNSKKPQYVLAPYIDAYMALQPLNGAFKLSEIGQDGLLALKGMVNLDKHVSPIRHELNLDKGSSNINLRYDDNSTCANAGIPHFIKYDFTMERGSRVLSIETGSPILSCEVNSLNNIVPWISHNGFRYNLDWCLQAAVSIGTRIIETPENVK